MNIAIGALSLALTLGFGLYAIISRRKSLEKISISFERKECYSLVKNEIENLNISVIHNKSMITNSIILFRGGLVNSGIIDIDKSRIHSPLRLVAPSGYKWLEAKLSKSNCSAVVKLKKTEDQVLEMEWDLLKKGEEIEFEAVIEVDQEISIEDATDELYGNMKFEYRITDLNKIDKISNSELRKERLKRRRRDMLLFAIFTGVIGLYFIAAFFLPPKLSMMYSSREIQYHVSTPEESILMEISSTNDGNLVARSYQEKRVLSVEEFNEEYSIENIHVVANPTILQKVMQGVMGGLFIVYFILILILRRKMTIKLMKQ